MPQSSGAPRLRVKTGCKTCRTRKKKCDEGRPVCERCLALGWRCEWPTQESLVDRRRAALRHPQRGKQQQQSNAIVRYDPKMEEQVSSESTWIYKTSVSMAQQALSCDITPHIFKHFVDQYYGLILLPNCHPEYHWSFLHELERLLPEYRSLQSTVLASGASHLHSTIECAPMQELSLNYYSQALQGLQELLGSTSQLEDNNGLLMSIMLLYTLGVTSQSAYSDIPGHMKAAVKIVTLRYFKSQATITQRFERLVLESVLNSMFMVSMGLWSDEFNLNNTFDLNFWLRAEQLLNQTNGFPVSSLGVDSPVIGVPIGLLKLLLCIRQLLYDPGTPAAYVLSELRSEISNWERAIIFTSDSDCPEAYESEGLQSQLTRDAASLFIITASILTEQMMEGNSKATIPLPHDPASPKLRRATAILRKYQDDETWPKFFNATIPVYTIGFFMTKDEDINLVRQDLQRRWDFTKFGQIHFCRSDLEATWARRGYGGSDLRYESLLCPRSSGMTM